MILNIIQRMKSRRDLKLHREREIRLLTVEKAHCVVVLAVAIYREGGEVVHVSEPKIVKIIARKKPLVLNGSSVKSTLALEAPGIIQKIGKPIVSPFAREFFATSEGVPPSLFARPPTSL